MSTLSQNPINTALQTEEPEKPNVLSILAICYYIMGAFGVISILLAGLILLIGIFMMTNGESMLSNPQYKELFTAILAEQGGKAATLDPKDIFMAGGLMYTVVGSVWLFFSLIFTTLLFYTASSISKGKRYLLCVIMSSITILSIPLGTILGVTALIFLMKPYVKQYFKAQEIQQ